MEMQELMDSLDAEADGTEVLYTQADLIPFSCLV